jgi:glycosyltransferase involved in cell wall biosynthesis
MRDAIQTGVSLLGQPLQALAPEPIAPPLVSFVLRNWNYAEYVGAAIDSVRAQDYPRFECIVVDNGSTDDSREAIARHVDDDPRFRVVHVGENLGPMGGALRGLDLAAGEFVAFIDSDDHVFPNFASVHIQTHLALPRSVALTTNNLVEISTNGTLIGGTKSELARQWPDECRGLRPARSVPRLATVSDDLFAQLHESVVLYRFDDMGFLWAPGTANLYRKFVLDLVRPRCDAQTLTRLSADGHFGRLCHVIGGSALIGLPLSAYRIHDRNYYTTSPSLSGMNPGGGVAVGNMPVRRREAARVIIEQVEDFGRRIGDRVWPAMDRMLSLSGRSLREAYSAPETRKMIAAALPQFVEFFGATETLRELRDRMSSGTLRAVVREAFGGKIPATLRRKMLKQEFKRVFRKRRRM